MHLNQSQTKSHQWQFWKKHRIISQIIVHVIISWSLKAAMPLCFHSLTKHTWVTPSQTQRQHNITQQCELGLSEEVLIPWPINMVLTWSLKAVSGHRVLSVQLELPSAKCPTWEGAQTFWGWENSCIFQQNHLSPWWGNSKVAFHTRKL